MASTAVSFALVENFYSDGFLERIAENFAIIETGAKNYYRNRHEVDIILKSEGKILPIEVKFGEAETKSVLLFLDEFDLKKAIILTKELFDEKSLDGKEILLVPLWAFSLIKESYIKHGLISGLWKWKRASGL